MWLQKIKSQFKKSEIEEVIDVLYDLQLHSLPLKEDEVVNLKKDKNRLLQLLQESSLQKKCLQKEFQLLEDEVKSLRLKYSDSLSLIKQKEDQIQLLQDEFTASQLEISAKDSKIEFLQNTKESEKSYPCIPAKKIDCQGTCVSCSLDGNLIATGGKIIKIWHSRQGFKCPSYEIKSFCSQILSLCFGKNTLVCGASDHSVRVFNLSADPKLERTFTGHTNIVTSVSINDAIFSGSLDRTIRIWQDKCLGTMFGESQILDICSLNSESVYSGHLDGKIKLWDANNLKQVTMYSYTQDQTCSICLKDPNTLVALSLDNVIRILDLRSNQKLELNQKQILGKTKLGLSNGKNYLTCGSQDGTIFLWDLRTLNLVQLKGHESQVTQVSWESKATRMYSIDQNGQMTVWTT